MTRRPPAPARQFAPALAALLLLSSLTGSAAAQSSGPTPDTVGGTTPEARPGVLPGRAPGIATGVTVSPRITPGIASDFTPGITLTPRVQASTGNHRAAWTLIGGGIGFGAGLLLGLQTLDDAVYAERKITGLAIGTGVGGAILGNLLSRPSRPEPTAAPVAGGRGDSPAGRGDSLTNGMIIGAVAGAGVGMWYVPAANCETDINPECPRVLRIAVGLPAIAGGAALGALVDRLTGRAPRQTAQTGPVRTLVAPVIGRRTIGVHIQRVF